MYKKLKEKLFGSLHEIFISDRLLQDTLNDSRQRALILLGVLAVSACSGLFMAVGPGTLYAFSGEQLDFFATLIAVTCAAILLVLESFGVVFPQIFPDAHLAIFSFTTWVMTLSLVVPGLTSYEGDFESLTRRILEERRLFAHEALHDPLTGPSNRKMFFSRAKKFRVKVGD